MRMTEKLLGIPDLCRVLDAAPSTIRKWRAENLLPPPDQIQGGRVLWEQATVDRMVRPDPSRNRRRPPATVCGKGHDLTDPDVLYVSPTGKRNCRVCLREADRRRAANR
jgi:predicted DNA-binding transcriptional regulator AlpA